MLRRRVGAFFELHAECRTTDSRRERKAGYISDATEEPGKAVGPRFYWSRMHDLVQGPWSSLHPSP